MKSLGASDPRVVGAYRVLAELGRGGMGRVLLACGPDGQLVALKQVRVQWVEDDGFRERFRREVAASRRVAGAYTAAVVDADSDADVPWLASEFVPGPSLKEAIEATGAIPEEPSLRLAAGLAAALAEIHRAGLVHRDLKPSNVLLADDGPKVIDFGIARATDSEGGSELTHTGWLAGSPGFMSPEQAEGHELTPASDVFSLGSVLAMASTGKGPFAGPSTPQTLYNVVHTEPDLSAVPTTLRPIIESCLAKDPAGRPSPTDLLEAITAAATIPTATIPTATTPTATTPTATTPTAATPTATGPTATGPTAGATVAVSPWPDGVRQMIADQHAEVARLLATPQVIASPEPDTDIQPDGATDAPTLFQPNPVPGPSGQPGSRRPTTMPYTAVASQPARPRALPLVLAGAFVGLITIVGILAWALAPNGGSANGSSANGSSANAVTAPAQQAGVLSGDTGLIASVAFSPDGRTLATTSDDQTTRLWDVASHHQIGRPVDNGMSGVAFSPNGRTLATANSDGVRLWDVASHQQIGQPLTDPGQIVPGAMSLALSPDGRTLAVGSLVDNVRLWDLTSRQPIGQPLRIKGPTFGLAFSPDGRTLATGGMGGAQLWDVASQQPNGQPLTDPNDLIFGVAFSPDGQTLATVGGANNAARLWDVSSHQQIGRAFGSGLSGVAFSPDGHTLATAGGNAGGDSSARLWTVASQQQIGQALPDGILCVTFSPDGRTLAVGGTTSARLWSVPTGH